MDRKNDRQVDGKVDAQCQEITGMVKNIIIRELTHLGLLYPSPVKYIWARSILEWFSISSQQSLIPS